ncbi:hypothetical protein ASD78_12360 [Lysobacter sp. Root667]|nr:hypothetical protein ASD78_12360 [Lysobacter sp. Root667]
MRPLSFVVLVIAVGAATQVAAQANVQPHTRYLELINRARDSLVSLAIAPAGGETFRELPIGEPLRGGGASTTLEVDGGNCVYDFRMVFRDGRAAIYRDIDVCRYRSLHVRPLPRVATDGRLDQE